jgi:hypothetical protein
MIKKNSGAFYIISSNIHNLYKYIQVFVNNYFIVNNNNNIIKILV